MTDQSPDSLIAHDGGPCPVHPLTVVRPKFRGPPNPDFGIRIRVAPAIRLDWTHDGGDDDIVGYEVLEDRGPLQ